MLFPSWQSVDSDVQPRHSRWGVQLGLVAGWVPLNIGDAEVGLPCTSQPQVHHFPAAPYKGVWDPISFSPGLLTPKDQLLCWCLSTKTLCALSCCATVAAAGGGERLVPFLLIL